MDAQYFFILLVAVTEVSGWVEMKGRHGVGLGFKGVLNHGFIYPPHFLLQDTNAKIDSDDLSAFYGNGAQSLTQLQGSSIILHKHSLFFTMGNNELSLKQNAQIALDPRSSVNLTRGNGLTMGERSLLSLGEAASLSMDTMAIGDHCRVTQQSASVVEQHGETDLQDRSNLTIGQQARLSHTGTLEIREQSTFIMGTQASFDSQGKVALGSKSKLVTGEKVSVSMGGDSSLTVKDENILDLGDGSQLTIGKGSSLQLTTKNAWVRVGKRASFKISVPLTCIVTGALMISPGQEINVYSSNPHVSGLSCYDA